MIVKMKSLTGNNQLNIRAGNIIGLLIKQVTDNFLLSDPQSGEILECNHCVQEAHHQFKIQAS